MELSFEYGPVHSQFQGYQDKDVKLGSQPCRNSPELTDGKDVLALNWQENLLLIGPSAVSFSLSYGPLERG